MLKRLPFVIVLVSALNAFAFSGITYLSNTPITRFDAQYGQDSVRITINLPVQNPDNCSLADGTYETDASLAGSKLQQAALLGAFLAGKQVELAISGCGPNGHPRIINVSVLQ